MDNSFRDGVLKTTGTDVDRILPPVSRFGGGNRAAKKDGIIAKLQAFFDKYFGLIWRINPSMVIKGNRNKEKVLMDEFLATQKEYDKKRKARKNGKKQKTVKG